MRNADVLDGRRCRSPSSLYCRSGGVADGAGERGAGDAAAAGGAAAAGDAAAAFRLEVWQTTQTRIRRIETLMKDQPPPPDVSRSHL